MFSRVIRGHWSEWKHNRRDNGGKTFKPCYSVDTGSIKVKSYKIFPRGGRSCWLIRTNCNSPNSFRDTGGCMQNAGNVQRICIMHSFWTSLKCRKHSKSSSITPFLQMLRTLRLIKVKFSLFFSMTLHCCRFLLWPRMSRKNNALHGNRFTRSRNSFCEISQKLFLAKTIFFQTLQIFYPHVPEIGIHRF